MEGKCIGRATCDEGSARSRGATFPLVCLVLLFCASRIFLWYFGVKPDVSHIYSHWQYLDVELLRTDLLKSLLFLHSQPPLWNALVGGLLQASHGDEGFLQISWVVGSCMLSLLTGVMIFELVARIGGSRLLAVLAISSWFFLGGAYYYENYLFYPLFTAFFATFVVWCFFRAVISDATVVRHVYLLGVGLGLLILSLTWTLFHPLWVAITIVATAAMLTQQGKRTPLLIAIMIIAMSSVVPMKNAYVFGLFSAGSWAGLNFAEVAPTRQDSDKFKSCGWDVLDEATCSQKWVRISGSRYETHPSLVACVKSRGGINFNHAAYIAKSQACSQLAIKAIWDDLPAYVINRILALGASYQLLPEQYYFHPLGIEKVQPYIDLRNRIYIPRGSQDYRYLGAPLGGLWLLFSWIVLTLDKERSRRWERKVLVIAGFLIGWVLFAGHAFTGVEQQRMRFTVEPLSIFVCYSAIPAMAGWVKRWSAGLRGPFNRVANS